jgi:glycolate oxidase FAD binding subunit
MGVTTLPLEVARLATEVDGAPDAAVTVGPATPAEVADVLRHATAGGLVVQVWGGGTRSGYGSPRPPDVVMTTERLSAVESWEPDDMTLTIGAGARVGEIESMLIGRSQTAVMPERPGRSTIGGVIAAGASSLRRGRLYGTRERVLEATVVTGDGRIVRSGGRVVKNVTGYDLTRLHVGAFGSLGVLVSVCLKLWPVPPAAATVTVEGPGALAGITRPLAVLEEPTGTRLYLWGTEAEVEAMVERAGGRHTPGLDWPPDPAGRFRWSLRVPPGLTSEAVSRLPQGWGYLAVHGVGEIRLASDSVDGASEMREWAESVGGAVVVASAPDGGLGELDPWGREPAGLDMQRRLIAQFDPGRVINPGRLPGGI